MAGVWIWVWTESLCPHVSDWSRCRSSHSEACILPGPGLADLTGHGFGGFISSTDLLAQRTIGRPLGGPKVHFNPLHPPPPPLNRDKAVHTQGGAHTRRCTQKAVCGHRRSLVF